MKIIETIRRTLARRLPKKRLWQISRQIYWNLPSRFRSADPVRAALRCIKCKGMKFVQIGANDGLHHDFIHDFALKQSWQGLLVEPNPPVFERLKQNYQSISRNLSFEGTSKNS